MKSSSAHVESDRSVSGEPLNGDADDADSEMTPQELEELDAALDEAEAQVARGEYVNAREFALSLLAKS